MSWRINFVDDDDPEKTVTVDLDDLSPAVFDKIAEDDPDGTWWGVYMLPGAHFSRAYKVICAAAEFAGVKAPDQPTTMRAAQGMVDMLDRKADLEEIENQPMVDGLPKVPESQETGSSSISSDDTTGLPTSSEGSASETC